MTADLRRLVNKNYGDALNTVVCTRDKEITKKNFYNIKNGMSMP